jgi:hypothetical protein
MNQAIKKGKNFKLKPVSCMGKAKIHTGMAQKAYEMSVALVLKHFD